MAAAALSRKSRPSAGGFGGRPRLPSDAALAASYAFFFSCNAALHRLRLDEVVSLMHITSLPELCEPVL